MNTNQKHKNINFEKKIFKFMNNKVSEKAMENVRKHRDIKLVTQKEGDTIWCLNQIIILQSFSQKSY